jgi:hypothetical protein
MFSWMEEEEEIRVINEWDKNKKGMKTECVAMPWGKDSLIPLLPHIRVAWGLGAVCEAATVSGTILSAGD